LQHRNTHTRNALQLFTETIAQLANNIQHTHTYARMYDYLAVQTKLQQIKTIFTDKNTH